MLPSISKASSKRVEKTTAKIHAALGQTEQHRTQSVERLEAIIKSAELKRADLQKQLPELSCAADVAVGENRDTAHRDYLRAKDNIRRCDQVFNSAKRELIIARNL